MSKFNESHNDGPGEVFEQCDGCLKLSYDLHKCAEPGCEKWVHKHCAESCESCGEVMCDAHKNAFDDCFVCTTCLPDVVKYAVEFDAKELEVFSSK